MDLAERLQELRKKAGYSQEQVVEIWGIFDSRISGIVAELYSANMSYDLMVFERTKAPKTRKEFFSVV